MKASFIVTALLILNSTAFAKSCDDVKAEIEVKLTAKKVAAHTLEVVNNADVKDLKIIGSCNGGTQKIAYKRN
jgi:hypothetical protein